jgi:hypothetical protein
MLKGIKNTKILLPKQMSLKAYVKQLNGVFFNNYYHKRKNRELFKQFETNAFLMGLNLHKIIFPSTTNTLI